MIKKETIHKFFKTGIFLKALNAIFEIIGGVLFLVISLEKINYFIFFITQGELSEDPKDFVANHLINFFQSLSINSQLFGSVYLISHGFIKIFLIYGLLKRKLWAYPLSIGVFTLFIVYQIFRYTHTGSVGLLLLSALDIFIVISVVLEYKLVRFDKKQ